MTACKHVCCGAMVSFVPDGRGGYTNRVTTRICVGCGELLSIGPARDDHDGPVALEMSLARRIAEIMCIFEPGPERSKLLDRDVTWFAARGTW